MFKEQKLKITDFKCFEYFVSRRTSGVVSPSELPDSPTQTVLPSPRNHKTQNAEFLLKMQEEAVRPSVRHLCMQCY